MLYLHNLLYKFWEDAWFFDKYEMKNNLQNKTQITHFLIANKTIDFNHLCQVILYR